MMDLIPVQNVNELRGLYRVYTNAELAESSFEARYGRKPEKAFVFQQTEKVTYYYIPLRDEEVGLR